MTAVSPRLPHGSPAVRQRPARLWPVGPAGDHHGGAAGHLLPDPGPVQDVEEFLACLRLLKIWAGDPSFEELRRRSGVPSSTLADALSARRTSLPRLDVVRAFVRACGVPRGAVARWESAWRGSQARGRGVPAPAPGGGTTSAIPHQLPRDIAHFVGRGELLERLDRVHAEHAAGRWRSPLVALVGPAGAGKTALAVRWAHRVAGAYPDGQLHIDLRPAAPDRAVTTGEALPLALQALGVGEAGIPARLPGMIGLYRSLTHDRRLLVLIEGAGRSEQVRPLLPSGPLCLTLVTTRARLPGLAARDDALRLPLAPLRPPEAVELMASMLGRHFGLRDFGLRDTAGLWEVARRCGYLPLALRLAVAGMEDAPGERGQLDLEQQVRAVSRLDQVHAGVQQAARTGTPSASRRRR